MKYTTADLLPIFREIFENDEIEISETTVAADIPEWDSLNHIYLVVAIEKHFKKKFTTHQIQSWQCVGDVLTEINNQ
jgi:acyl carrier protein